MRVAAGQPMGRPLGELLHEPLFVPRTTPVKRLFLTFKQKKVHMAIVVSEYGKVLGLVTMDDLLAQIFGQLRDERAELQSSIPGRQRARTPMPGVPITGRASSEVTGTDYSEPVSKLDDSDLSVPVELQPPETGEIEVPSRSLRSIHIVDEVTPPAVDVSELRRETKPS